MVTRDSPQNTRTEISKREPAMKSHLLALLALLCSSWLLGGDPPAELKYARRATRDETRKATLDAHENPGERIRALLDYQLDGDFPRNEEEKYYRILTLPLPEGIQLEPGGIEIGGHENAGPHRRGL